MYNDNDQYTHTVFFITFYTHEDGFRLPHWLSYSSGIEYLSADWSKMLA
jgi:hypothetical protein